MRARRNYSVGDKNVKRTSRIPWVFEKVFAIIRFTKVVYSARQLKERVQVTNFALLLLPLKERGQPYYIQEDFADSCVVFLVRISSTFAKKSSSLTLRCRDQNWT